MASTPELNRDRQIAAKTCFTTMASPVGELLLVSDGTHLTGLYMEGHAGGKQPLAHWLRQPGAFVEVIAQLQAYFAGTLRHFDLPMLGVGTSFQQKVWRGLMDIPHGETISYVELARRIGQPTASRAVGLANGRNPLSIIVPCHRVIGASGALTGYGGGVDRKRWLLRHEGVTLREDSASLQRSAQPSLL